jgi:hypothetical protein
VPEKVGRHTVHGAVKAYRVTCLENFGGLRESMGWDGIDEYGARARGWWVLPLTELSSLHYGLRGEKLPWARARWEEGVATHFMGYLWRWALVRVAYRALVERPRVLGGLALGLGFAWSRITRRPMVDDAEARRLLREANVPEGFAFVFNNRNLPEPYEPLAIWLVDQWKKIGLNATVRVLESAAWFHALRSGDFEVSMDGQCGYIVEPDLDLYKFLSADRTDASYGRFTDRPLDALYDRQARARDVDERRRLVREFEKRLLDEQAHVIPTLWWHRIVPYHARVRGFTITPSHFLNGQLDTIWLAE